jgi:hypothetical protein
MKLQNLYVVDKTPEEKSTIYSTFSPLKKE